MEVLETHLVLKNVPCRCYNNPEKSLRRKAHFDKLANIAKKVLLQIFS